MKLRTKFLLSLLLISSALTCATLLSVRHAFQVEIRRVLIAEQRSSLRTFENFDRDRLEHITRAAELLASLPTLKAVMTSRDASTIQDASGELWPSIKSDLFMLSDREGKVLALHTSAKGITVGLAEQGVKQLVSDAPGRNWWFAAGHLFEVFSQPVYFGSPSSEHLLGTLSVGYEFNDRVAAEIGTIAASQVFFAYGDSVAASTLPRGDLSQIAAMLDKRHCNDLTSVDLTVGREPFLSTCVALTTSPVPVSLVALKSWDEATLFLHTINRILISLGLVAIFVGSALVFFISHTFTKPLDDLLAGVRALAAGNFEYPLHKPGNDELTELTHAFDRMRSSLQRAQERLLEAERMATIGRMASSISHDLRHRLTAVVANAEFLVETHWLPARREEFYGEVSAAVDQMTDLLESLLEFSRTPQSLRPELVRLENVARRSIRAIRAHPQFQRVTINVLSEGNIEGWFDAKKLERVFYNLLLNACEMLPREAGKIDISIRRSNEHTEPGKKRDVNVTYD